MKFDICFSSSYKRILATAEILLDGNEGILLDERLAERGFGSLEGGSTDVRYTADFWDYYLNRSNTKSF